MLSTRPSAPLIASTALLIDAMPECDCQHAMNAETRDLTASIVCDLEQARGSLSRHLSELLYPFISQFLFID